MVHQHISPLAPTLQTATDSALIITDKYLNIRYITRAAKSLLTKQDKKRFFSLEQILPKQALETIKTAITTLMGTIKGEVIQQITTSNKAVVWNIVIQPLQSGNFQMPYFTISIEEISISRNPKIVKIQKYKKKPDLSLPNHLNLSKKSNGLNIDFAKVNGFQNIFNRNKPEFNALAELGFDSVTLYGLASCKMEYCSDRAVHFFGYESKQAFLQTNPSVNSPKLQADGVRSIERIKEYISSVQKNNRQFDFEWTIKRKNGTLAPCWASVFPIEIHGERFILTTLRDITEQKQREEELKKRNRFIEKVTESYPHVVQILDLNQSKVVYSNAKAGYLGYSETELEYSMGLAMKNIIHPDDWHHFTKRTLSKIVSLKDGETLDHEYRIRQ